ncbi:MAG: hypothetical protein WCG81_00620 [Candidatus Angelobacter sp.]
MNAGEDTKAASAAIGSLSQGHEGDIEHCLAPFLNANPTSKLRKEKSVYIVDPWGDSSLEIRVGDKDGQLVADLNSIVLPPPLAAIYHRDTRAIEIIYTALGIEDDIEKRRFIFRFDGDEYLCKFSKSSDKLIRIALATRAVSGATHTSHRHLSSFWQWNFLNRARLGEKEERTPKTTPFSFWIENIDWEPNKTIELANNLNFFMYYFHRVSPLIDIYEESTPQDPYWLAPYPLGSFPEIIAGKKIDPYLLRVWHSTVSVDPLRKFLYNYQIVEYAAFYYIQDTVLQSVRKIIQSPEAPSRIAEAVRAIVESVTESRMDDEAKLPIVIKQLTCVDDLWKEIAPRQDFFSRELIFDGGFSLPPLIKADWTVEDFKTAWIPKYPDSLRKIRNALVHAREARMAKSIAPTLANMTKLRPWAALIAATAMQVVLYG